MKKIFNDIKYFIKNDFIKWIKDNIGEILNFLIFVLIYIISNSYVQLISGLWLFVLLGYYIFIKLIKIKL